MGSQKTTAEFIEQANRIHNGFYSYERTVYKKAREKVIVTCPLHGDFEQTPNGHLNGKGCRKCGYVSLANKFKLSLEEFIKKANEVHNNHYDYSLSEYTNAHTKLTVICPTHGRFEQTPYHHLRGSGCPKCAGKNKTTEEWVEQAKAVHGDKYNYENSEYKTAKEKIEIICPVHGSFWQQPTNHLRGNKCPECAKKQVATKRTSSIEEWVEQAKAVHTDKYDYTFGNYKNSHKKIMIICPIHGDFTQTPSNHLQGQGCPKCAGKNKTTEEWVEQAKAVHGDLYDYSLVEYKNSTTKVKIICKEHGVFEQLPSNHLKGNGCPKCGNLIGGWGKASWCREAKKEGNQAKLYKIRCWNEEEEFWKVGITFSEIRQRFSGKLNMPYNYEILDVIEEEPEEIWELEKTLHKQHKKLRYTPNIKFGGYTECFSRNLKSKH